MVNGTAMHICTLHVHEITFCLRVASIYAIAVDSFCCSLLNSA